MGEGKEILKFDGGEEIKPCTECTVLYCTYLGTQIDQLGGNTNSKGPPKSCQTQPDCENC